MGLLVYILAICVSVMNVQCEVEFCDVYPDTVESCFARAQGHPLEDPRLVEAACVQDYYEDYRHRHELTNEDLKFIQERVDNRFGHKAPQTGYRVRRDIRVLSEEERKRVWNVFDAMYWNGTLGRFARIHTVASRHVHRGAAFLPWHRVFLADFEEEMRKIDPNVSLPYWDYTIDNNITQPRDAVVWSDCFFGNSRGEVTSGPFAGWFGGRHRPIRRHAGRSSWLVSKYDMQRLLSFCHFANITTTGRRPYLRNFDNLELLHDEVHFWVGGDMERIALAAFDPVFWFVHAFVDLTWEIFRQNQVSRCDVDAEVDYRPLDDLSRDGRIGHEPDSPMFAYKHLRNMDGLWHNWTRLFYGYEEMPACPDCGNSEYLYCYRNVERRYAGGVCLTRTRRACTQD